MSCYNNSSSVEIYDAQTIEIKKDCSGKAKIILDGKEVDLSKVRSVDIHWNCMGITIEADIVGGSLPIKE